MTKLSFKPLDPTDPAASVTELAHGGCDTEQISEIAQGFASLCEQEDIEAALCITDGCLAVRVFDMGRYLFPFPFELDGADSDISAAVERVVLYCIKEEVPIVFTDVPYDACALFSSLGYKHIEMKREGIAPSPEEQTYRVRLLTECTELDVIPCVKGDRLTLDALTESDVAAYAELSRDESSIAVWGYDYREDVPDAQDAYFYSTAMEELGRGVALTLSARLGGRVVGEAVFYAFDARGGADFAFRLLPQVRGMGLGRELLLLAFDAARELGLDQLCADVLKKNAVSVALLSSYMKLVSDDTERQRYYIEL